MEKSDALFSTFKLHEGLKEKESQARKKAPKDKQIKFVMVDQYGKTIKKKDIIAAMKGEKTKTLEALTGVDASYLTREAEREKERKDAASKAASAAKAAAAVAAAMGKGTDSNEEFVPTTGKISRRKTAMMTSKDTDCIKEERISPPPDAPAKGKGKGIDTIVNVLLNINKGPTLGQKKEAAPAPRAPSISSVIENQFSSESYESTLLKSVGKGVKRPASPTQNMQRFNAPSLRDLAGPMGGLKDSGLSSAAHGHYAALSSHLPSGMHAPSARAPQYHHQGSNGHSVSSPRHYSATLVAPIARSDSAFSLDQSTGSGAGGGGGHHSSHSHGNGHPSSLSHGNVHSSSLSSLGNGGGHPSLHASSLLGSNPMSFPVGLSSSLSLSSLMSSSPLGVAPSSAPHQLSSTHGGASLGPVPHSSPLGSASLSSALGPAPLTSSLGPSSLSSSLMNGNGTRGLAAHLSPPLVASTPCQITQSTSVLSDVDSVPISRGTSWIDQLLNKD